MVFLLLVLTHSCLQSDAANVASSAKSHFAFPFPMVPSLSVICTEFLVPIFTSYFLLPLLANILRVLRTFNSELHLFVFSAVVIPFFSYSFSFFLSVMSFMFLFRVHIFSLSLSFSLYLSLSISLSLFLLTCLT